MYDHGIHLLFDANSSISKSRKVLQDKYYYYNDPDEIFSTRNIIKVINYINSFKGSIQLPILFELNAAKFEDKFSLTLFECITYYIMVKFNRRVFVKFNNLRHSISGDGIHSSPLLLLTTNKLSNCKKYVNIFANDIYQNHFRRYILSDKAIGTSLLSRLYDDIAAFQIMFEVNKEYRESLAEVLVELISNACEHTDSDCLIDVDIAPHYRKKNEDGEFYGINICILNFSSQLFPDDIKKKLNGIRNSDKLTDRYKQLLQAERNHSKYFCEQYSFEDFCTIAAFQHKISGRYDNNITGGTGLTKLIKELQNKSDTYKCYMLSGNKRFIFREQYLSYDQQDWIGFNANNDFLNFPPDITLFKKSDIFFPGSAYNLAFVFKKEN